MKKLFACMYIVAASLLFGYAKAKTVQVAYESVSFPASCFLYLPPVSFEDITVSYTRNNAEINWSTATETGSKQFEIQRSANGEDFKTIALLFTLDDSNSIKNYKFKDELKNVKRKDLLYRIKQTDINNNFSFSKTVLLNTAETPGS